MTDGEQEVGKLPSDAISLELQFFPAKGLVAKLMASRRKCSDEPIKGIENINIYNIYI